MRDAEASRAPTIADRQASNSKSGKSGLPPRPLPIVAIMATFDEGGGNDYLKTVAQTDPRTFCTLLGKILPTQVTGDDEAGPVRIEYSWLPPQSKGS